jgi:hypothetical protein
MRGQEIPQWLMYRLCWRHCLNMSLRYACSVDEAFFVVKSKTTPWDCFLQVLDYQDDFQIIGCEIKGILLCTCTLRKQGIIEIYLNFNRIILL